MSLEHVITMKEEFSFVVLVTFIFVFIVDSQTNPEGEKKSIETSNTLFDPTLQPDTILEKVEDNESVRSITSYAKDVIEYGENLLNISKKIIEAGELKQNSDNLNNKAITMDTYYETIMFMNHIASLLQSDGKEFIDMAKKLLNVDQKITRENKKLIVIDNTTITTAVQEMKSVGQMFFDLGKILTKTGNQFEKSEDGADWIKESKELDGATKKLNEIGTLLSHVASLLSSLTYDSKAIIFLDKIVGRSCKPEVCFNGYEDLGCFSLVNLFHERNRIPVHCGNAPWHPEDVDTQIYLYTRPNIMSRYMVTKRPYISLRGSDFNPERTTFIITHGVHGDASCKWMISMKDAFLNKYDVNVFLVGWQNGVDHSNYYRTVSNVKVVGAELARLVMHLIRKEGLQHNKINTIGHCLGAHVMAYLATLIKAKTDIVIGQIIALDPPAALFEKYHAAGRLDPKYAEFVQVIHTSGRMWQVGGLGMVRPHGHVDFYLNGGSYQPACSAKLPFISDSFIFTVMDLFESDLALCHHNMAYNYLLAAMTSDNCTFWGYKADGGERVSSRDKSGTERDLTILDYVNMNEKSRDCSMDNCTPLGIYAINYPARGIFVVHTSDTQPYCEMDPNADVKMVLKRRKYIR